MGSKERWKEHGKKKKVKENEKDRQRVQREREREIFAEEEKKALEVFSARASHTWCSKKQETENVLEHSIG